MANQALELKDFSGGMTDNYIGAAINKYQAGSNMFIRPGNPAKLQSRPGSEIFDADYYQVPYVTTRKRVDSMHRFFDTNIYQSQNKLHYIKGTGWDEVVGPTGGSAFINTVAQFDQCSYCEWSNHLIVTNDKRTRPIFILKNGPELYLRTVGLPKPSIAGIGVTAGSGDNRGYVFVYSYSYTIDGVEYSMRGPVSDILTYTGPIANNFTNLPVLTNGAGENYDTTVIELEVYRTRDAEDTFYKIDYVTNGTTILTDNIADVDLNDGLLLYTDAEQLDYHQPPKCKYVIQLNGCVYYMNIEDSLGDIYPNRIVQAPSDLIYAANEGNSVDLDEANTGGAIAGQNAIAFSANRTYRLEGTYDSTGNGGIQKVEISRTVGCISHKSIVQTQGGCYFAAKDGFYFTDGYQVLRISEDIPETYEACVATEAMQKRITATYDPFTKRVYWAASGDVSQADNNQIFVAHLYFGLKVDVPFTIWNGGLWPANFSASSIMFYDGTLLRGDSDGYLLKHESDMLNDAKINTALTPDEWDFYPVIWDMRSAAFDFGSVSVVKWVTKIVIYADSLAKVAIGIFSNNDNSSQFLPLGELRSNSPITWGDNSVAWGDQSIRWSYLPVIKGMRRFPRRGLRTSYKQIQLTNSYTQIDSSSQAGTVTVDTTANTVTLNSPGIEWDDYSVDYYISFDEDDYTLQYLITERTSNTVLTIDDPDETLVSGSAVNFKVYGYRKNEAFRLLSYSIGFQFTNPTQTPFRAAGSTE
jgi:hypothetical protein